MQLRGRVPDVIDNQSYKLEDLLRANLPGTKRLSIVTAYINPPALRLLKDYLPHLEQCRLLLGREAISSLKPEEYLKSEVEEALSSLEWDLISEGWLADLIKDPKLEIRLHDIGRGILHGKAYILHDIQMGIVGSSNFTGAGLSSNLELNAVLLQDSTVQNLERWFDSLWQQSVDYKQVVLDALSGIYRLVDPYLLYLKVLYDQHVSLFDDTRDTDRDVSSIVLTNFQQHGFRSALRILERHRGVILADSVGLGKTYLGLKLVEHYNEPTLIVCPAALRDAFWRRHVDDLCSKGIPVHLMSMEDVSRGTLQPNAFPDVKLLIIDESHNFRSSGSRRWKHLMDWVKSNRIDKKVVLLTATPINNSIWDLYNQVALITGGSDSYFSPSIGNLKNLFVQAEEDNSKLYDLLNHIVVRRSRGFIRKYYPGAMIDGKEIRFAERKLHTVEYSLTSTYGEDLYHRVLSVLESLHNAHYQPAAYQADASDSKRSSQRSLARLVQMLLLKRAESSIYSLRESLRSQIVRIDAALNGAVQVTLDDLVEDDEDVAVDLGPFNVSEIALMNQHLEQDKRALEGVLSQIGDTLRDDKLDRLIYLLQNELKGKKVIIFTGFKDTATYLHHNIVTRLKISCGLVHGGIGTDERMTTIRRFAPIANDYEGSDYLDVLVTTDVLGEGMNLQDAQVVVNYDLPWNPMRLVQRIGRVDRIGTRHPVIEVYNFYPESGLDELLELTTRLAVKIGTVAETVGMDEQVLAEATMVPRDFNAVLNSIKQGDESVIDQIEMEMEVSPGESLRRELMEYISTAGRSRLESIPSGSGTVIRRYGDQSPGVFAAFKNRVTDDIYWIYRPDDGEDIITDKLMAIHQIRRRQGEPIATQHPGDDLLSTLKDMRDQLYAQLVNASVTDHPTFRTVVRQLMDIGKRSLIDKLYQLGYLISVRDLEQLANTDPESLVSAVQDLIDRCEERPFQKEDLICLAWARVL